MSDAITVLNDALRATRRELPASFERIVDQGLVNLKPWRLMPGSEIVQLQSEINARYAERKVIPFARRDDTDDVVCFVLKDARRSSGSVIIVHDFATAGYEVVAEFAAFEDWYKSAIDTVLKGFPYF